MRRSRRASLVVLTGLVALLGLSGCPQSPQLSVSPTAVSFQTTNNVINVFVGNTGGGVLNWSIEEVSRASVDAPWVTADVPWLMVVESSGSLPTGTARVELRADRSGQPVGLFNNTGIRVSSNGGERVVPVSMEVRQTLTVSPEIVSLAPTATRGEFQVTNVGTSTADWDIFFLNDADNPQDRSALPAGFIAEPNPGETAPGATTTVTVRFPAGQESFALLVASDSGGGIVQFRFGQLLQNITATPSPLTLFMNAIDVAENNSDAPQAPSTLTITNTGGAGRDFSLIVRDRSNPGVTPAISISPSAGTIPGGSEVPVEVQVSDVTAITPGSGNYELELTAGEGFLIVPLVIEVRSLPEIVLSESPDPNTPRPEVVEITTLDFGRELVQTDFSIANIGPRESRLFFQIEYEGQGEEDAVIASVDPIQSDTTQTPTPPDAFFFPPSANTLIHAERIRVTVDRTKLVEDVEFKRLTVRAYDEDFRAPLEAVEEKELLIRVERLPLKIEGATNRSRPPFLMRFVFLLRDSLGEVIPTQTPEDLARLNFSITEEGFPLDVNETNLFLDGPEDLKVNLALVLDYTGSMLNAGTTGPNPLRPGEALEQVNEAVKDFLDDLPPSYRVALLYHNDRQQSERVIANFSTDREALKSALDEFTLPEPLFGVTAVRDALIDAIGRVNAEDSAEALPFDDADVRAVMFITDGFDNASIAQLGEVTDQARDTRTRLYPLLYSGGAGINAADMLVLAEDTGGHSYTAGNVRNLSRLLANEQGLALRPTEATGSNRASFEIQNVGTAALDWSIPGTPDVPWITSITPSSGSLPPSGATTVTIRVNPELIGANNNVGALVPVNSNNGSGSVRVVARVRANTATVQDLNLELTDVPGTVWNELQNQLVLTYITPSQTGGDYQVRVEYQQDEDQTIVGFFEEDGVFFSGDIRAGQIAMYTSGIQEALNTTDPDAVYRAEVFVRTDYVPRNVNRFRVRFNMLAPEDASPAALAALDNAQMRVELAPDGLLVSNDPFVPDWRLIPEGDNSFLFLTDQASTLPYGAFGNLLKLTITNLGDYVALFDGAPQAPEFYVDMRVDNQIYVNPAAPGSPSQTVFFLYPSGATFPNRPLVVSNESDLAPPARTSIDLAQPGIDPELPDAWDRDEDGLPDFNDPFPDNEDFPGFLAAPNPLEIDPGVDVASVTVRNNRLDTFNWDIVEASLPSWIERVTFGAAIPGPGDSGPAPQASLAPGQTERINFHVDRTGLPSGFYDGEILIETDVFATELLPVTLIVIAE